MIPEGQEPNPVRVRRADERDMEALLTIERQCFNVYYYDYYMLDPRDFEFYLQDADTLFLVAVQEAHVVGYILGYLNGNWVVTFWVSAIIYIIGGLCWIWIDPVTPFDGKTSCVK